MSQRWTSKLFIGSQTANPLILGLIQLSQIRRFLRYASPQIANPQIVNVFLSSKFKLELICHIVRRKCIYLRSCESCKSANHKKIRSKNCKSARSHICGSSENLINYSSPQIFGLRFAKLICGPPTFKRSQ
jgi:hypothetical protein